MADETFVLVLVQRPERGMIRYSITYPNGLTANGAEHDNAGVLKRMETCMKEWNDRKKGG